MKNDSLRRFSDSLEKMAAMLVLILSLLFVVWLSFCAYRETSLLNTEHISGEHIEFYADNVFLSILVLALLLSASYLFYRNCGPIHPMRMELALLIWSFVLGTTYIATTKLRAPSFSDSFFVTYGAQRLALGDYAVVSEHYFYRFPFQLGYVLYSELFFRAANLILRHAPEGYAVLALQELNLCWLLLEYHALIETARLLFKDERIHKLLMLMLFFCLPPLLTTPYLYGSVPAFSCGICALWFLLKYLKHGEMKYALLCALAITAAVTLKLNLLIFFVAIAGTWLVMLLKKPTLKSLLCLLLTVACVLTIPSLPQRIYERRFGLRYGSGIPMICWMAMGLSEGYAAPGWYRSDYTVTAYETSGYDREATADNARLVIAERLRWFRENPDKTADFFSAKLRSQWNEPSYGSLWINQVYPSYSEKGRLYDFLCGSGARRTLAVMNQFQQFVFLCTLFGLIRLWKKKELPRCLLPMIVLGGLLYHLLFEAKSQYALPYFVLMLPTAAYGLFTLLRKVEYRP